jgi:hypothetical protein
MISFVYNKPVSQDFLTLACESGNGQLSQYEKQTLLAIGHIQIYCSTNFWREREQFEK